VEKATRSLLLPYQSVYTRKEQVETGGMLALSDIPIDQTSHASTVLIISPLSAADMRYMDVTFTDLLSKLLSTQFHVVRLCIDKLSYFSVLFCFSCMKNVV
jgi:hypothetical protein